MKWMHLQLQVLVYKVSLYSIWLSHMVGRSQKGTHVIAERFDIVFSLVDALLYDVGIWFKFENIRT